MNPLQLLPDLSIAGFIITMPVENLIGVHGICEMFWETTVLPCQGAGFSVRENYSPWAVLPQVLTRNSFTLIIEKHPARLYPCRVFSIDMGVGLVDDSPFCADALI